MLPPLHFAAHDVYRDDDTGLGYVVLPLPPTDVRDPFGLPTLHAVEWDDVARHLAADGWDITEGDEPQGWCQDGETIDGRPLIAIHAVADPLARLPWQPDRESASLAELRTLAGCVEG